MAIYRSLHGDYGAAHACLDTLDNTRTGSRAQSIAGAIIATHNRAREDARLADVRKSTRNPDLYQSPTRNLTPRLHSGRSISSAAVHRGVASYIKTQVNAYR